MEPIDTNPTEGSEERHKKSDHTSKEWDRMIEEEQARWRHLGINLDQLNYAGSELFMLNCKVQSLINCMLEKDTSEENMNHNMKMLIYVNMERTREAVEPQITQAKLMQGVPQAMPNMPQIIFPWMKNMEKGGNGS